MQKMEDEKVSLITKTHIISSGKYNK